MFNRVAVFRVFTSLSKGNNLPKSKNIQTFYSIFFSLKILLFIQSFLKMLNGIANSVDPEEH